MTQSVRVSPKLAVFATMAVSWMPALGQVSGDRPTAPQDSASEPIAVFRDHPRLLLPPARLRLLKRERERSSPRWVQLEALAKSNAPLPELGLVLALYYQIAGDAAAGRQAVAWVLSQGDDPRQVALVFDWCQNLLTPAQRQALSARLLKFLAQPADDGIPTMRTRVFAAVALWDHVAEIPNRELERAVRTWWEGKMAPELKTGRAEVPREDVYALYELLHVVRDNTNLDLRESCPQFFKNLPTEHLVTHYPASYPAAENDYRIGLMRKPDEPDLQAAALSRAAELAMVAYDSNAQESQILQGWLMYDRFMMRGTFGAPYEFLWANPYQPGLSYMQAPLVYHDGISGKLFVRSSWDDAALWFGYFDGIMQLFHDGSITLLEPRLQNAPLSLDEAVLLFAQNSQKFQVTVDEDQPAFILGLKPGQVYQVEIDDEEVFEAVADAGGIVELDLPAGVEVGLRFRQAPQQH
jgi:hypothetical protein